MTLPPANPDDRFDEQLAALDEIVSAGKTVNSDSVASGSKIVDQRLEKNLPCLQLLDKYWRRTRNPSSTGQHKTLVSSSTPPPSRIGKFEIIRELGRGGFGVVFLAKDTTLQYEVALKIPHAQALASPELRDRFRREAQVVAKLQHPNIVTVHEAGDVGPISYIVYAYCPGLSLAEWLKKQTEAVPVRTASEWVASMADAVTYAHERGILHRDLKPANIMMLSPELKQETALSILIPKITDFGLAKTLDSSKLTQTGGLLGTPAYMAPEQALKQRDAGPAIDIHALGLILYELLTGRPPFRGESEIETLEMVARQEPVSLRKIRPKLPRDLETICLKCLQKDPRQRYVSAQALSDDLRRYLNGKHILARPVGVAEKLWRQCRRHPLVTGLIAALITISIASVVIIEGNSRQRLEQAVVARTRFHVAVEGFRQQISMGRKLLDSPATYPAGREILLKAIDYYDELLKDAPIDTPLLEEAAEYSSVAGNLFREFGKNQEAEQRLDRAVDLYRHALESNSDRGKVMMKLGGSLMNIGHLYRHTDRIALSEKSYREASELFQHVGEMDDEKVKYIGDYCYAAGNLCAILNIMKRYDESIQVYKRSIELINNALLQDPQNVNCHFQKGLLLNDYGAVLLEQKQFEEAERFLKEALVVRKNFLDKWPQDLRSIKYLSSTHSNLADLYGQVKRFSESREHYEQTILLLDIQLKKFPVIPERIAAYAIANTDMAVFLEKQHDWSQAEKHYQTAIDYFERLCREYPHIDVHYHSRTEAKFLLARSLRQAGDAEKANELGKTAMNEYVELCKRKPANEKLKTLHFLALQF